MAEHNTNSRISPAWEEYAAREARRDCETDSLRAQLRECQAALLYERQEVAAQHEDRLREAEEQLHEERVRTYTEAAAGGCLENGCQARQWEGGLHEAEKRAERAEEGAHIWERDWKDAAAEIQCLRAALEEIARSGAADSTTAGYCAFVARRALADELSAAIEGDEDG